MLVEILFGSMGSGKSTYSATFTEATVISQDRQGRKGHLRSYKQALTDKVEHIIIDRINHTRAQRKRYIDLAIEAGYRVKITTFFVAYDEALERILAREGHPTIPAGNLDIAMSALDMFFKHYEYPSDDEIPLVIEKPT